MNTSLIVPLICVLSVPGVLVKEASSISYIGCFDSGFSIIQDYHHYLLSFSLDVCVDNCRLLGTRYAGLDESDGFCYCGDDIVENSTKVADTECYITCSGESTRTCGGASSISVYDLGQPLPRHLSGDLTSVTVLVGQKGRVALYNLSSLEIASSATVSEGWACNLDYHYSKNLALAFSSNKLFKWSLEPTSCIAECPTTVVSGMGNCEGFAVDWAHDLIYWANCSSSGEYSIMVMDLDGGNKSVVLRREQGAGPVQRMVVDPYRGILWWIVEGVMESCEATGDHFRPEVSGAYITVWSLTLDLAKRRVYYVGGLNQSKSLYSVDYTGSDRRQHFSLPQMNYVYGLGLLHGHLYWMNYMNSLQTIYTAPLTNDTTSVQAVMTTNRLGRHMKLVHPDLQRQIESESYTDPCSDKGCSDLCTPISNTAARCICFPNRALVDDGKTCSS